MAEEKMRLWEVEVTVCVMVLAATRDEAERFAERDEDSCVSDSLRTREAPAPTSRMCSTLTSPIRCLGTTKTCPTAPAPSGWR